MNKQGVTMLGKEVVILAPKHKMTIDEAFQHAAWLVVMAILASDGEVTMDDAEAKFAKLVEEALSS